MSVDEAVKIGLQNYPAIKAAEMRKEKEKSLQKTAWDFGDTELYYSVEETDGSANGGIESYGVKQSIDFPLMYIYRSNYLASKTEQRNKEFDFIVTELKRNIYLAYFDLLYAKSALNTVRSLDSVYADFERAARLKYEKGETNKLEMINAVSEQKK
ncbi:MAG: TolC family protein [Melioribacteraceae bacterium]|nr:TolC family protein [Melioribacteraceae bacterium]